MSEWISVCKDKDLLPGVGLCALHLGEQVALFKSDVTNEIYAVSNYDPIGEANVLSRGIIGSVGDAVVVASPLYKQHYNLQTGQCLEDETVCLKTYATRIQGDSIELALGS
jgi:nitrite reductase (NADH) small subunit